MRKLRSSPVEVVSDAFGLTLLFPYSCFTSYFMSSYRKSSQLKIRQTLTMVLWLFVKKKYDFSKSLKELYI